MTTAEELKRYWIELIVGRWSQKGGYPIGLSLTVGAEALGFLINCVFYN